MNEKNSFKLSLKENVPIVKHTEFQTSETLLLKKLGLLNLPENIKVKIEDGYVKIKIAEENPSWDEFDDNCDLTIRDENGDKPQNSNNHIVFKLPLEDENLNNLNNYPQSEELRNRYELYSTEYRDKIKEYSSQERKILQEQFPDLVFNIKIRMKSLPSYLKKLNKNIEEKDKSVFIDDIIAERIIISEFNGSRDPKVLNNACYQVEKALYDFRINTDFRMKNRKDYITNPKDNGYQSLHLLMEDKTNPDCTYETQIRTYDMEYQAKKDSNISHKKYKPRLINEVSSIQVPKYSEVTNFWDSDGNPVILDLPMKDSFYHYYDISLDQYRKELGQIQEFVKLSTLRKNLKSIVIQKKSLDENVK